MPSQIVKWYDEKSAIEFFKIIDYIKSYTDEIFIEFKNNEMIMNFTDCSQIIIFSIKIKVKTPKPFTLFINLDDFAKILKTNVSDNRILEMDFNIKENKITVYHTREEDSTIIKKTLIALDGTQSEYEKRLPEIIDLENKAKYNGLFSLTKETLTDIFYENEGIFDTKTNITVYEDKIVFSEYGQIGFSLYKIPYEHLTPFEFNSEEVINSSYSLVFLKGIKKALAFLKNDDLLKFSLNTDSLLKIEFSLDSLEIPFFILLKPRIEIDPEDDDDMDEF
jgi:hypothetical protein